MEQCCGACKFHRTSDSGEWVCTNDLSECYALIAVDRMIDLLQRMKELWEKDGNR